MNFKLINDSPQMFAVVFQTGDEVMAGLQQFAQEQNLAGSHFTAIGAFSDVLLGFFNFEKREYDRIPIAEQVEAVSLVGDITLGEGKPQVHAHAVVARSDGHAFGGHLLEAHVRPTLEVILTESPRHLRRVRDPVTGLGLIELQTAKTTPHND